MLGDSYNEAVGLIERIFRLPVAKHVAERLAEEDSAPVDAYYPERLAPEASEEGPILVVQVDGKGVRMVNPHEAGNRPTRKKEEVVTAVYSVGPHLRNAEAIADTLAGKPRDAAATKRSGRPDPIAKELHATLAGKDTAFDDLQAAVAKRDGPHFRHRVALTDGDPALQTRVADWLPGFTLVLDIVHAAAHVRASCAAILGEGNPILQDNVAWRLDEVLTGRVGEVITCLRDQTLWNRKLAAVQTRTVAVAIGSLRRNAPYMRYDEYFEQG